MGVEDKTEWESLGAVEVPYLVPPMLPPDYVSSGSDLGASRGILEGVPPLLDQIPVSTLDTPIEVGVWTGVRLGSLAAIIRLLSGVEGLRLSPLTRKRLLRMLPKSKLRVARRVRKKLHYKTKQKRRRDWKRKNSKRVWEETVARASSSPEGAWRFHKDVLGPTRWGITEEEWCRDIWPELGEGLYEFRLPPRKGRVTINNILIVDRYNPKVVLFDGTEYHLRSMGYIL